MKLLLKTLAVLVIALALGVGSAYLGIRWVGLGAAVRNGAWGTSLATGSSEAGIYTRAAVAVGGLFALSKKETLYYTAFVDDRGEKLSASCDYVLEGREIDARWWSFTVYGEDHFLVPNREQRYSYNMLSLQRRPDRSYQVHLSSRQHTGNWLPTGTSGEFSVTLRLYNPARSVHEHPDTVALPSITKVACR